MPFPYISGPGNITQMIHQLRKAFPATVNSDTIKKLGIAPNNESYLINALQFIGLIDTEGKKTAEGTKIFSNHKDGDFAKSFSDLIKKSYKGLFELHGDDAWTASDEDLITFFRSSDDTSDAIGRRQTSTFKVLAALSGHGEVAVKTNKPKIKADSKKPAKKPQNEDKGKGGRVQNPPNTDSLGGVALTVRVEINLPADGSKETYDNIFKSIKANLLNG